MIKKLVSNNYGGLFLFVLLAMIFAAIVKPTPEIQAADAQWQAQYWNNRTLSGSPVITRNEDNLNYDWGDGTPDQILLDKDNFSARWTRSVYFNAGSYRFTATTDDGMRIWVDNVLIIDSWWDSQVHTVTADLYLNSADHIVKVEYYEAGGKAIAKLSWSPVGSAAPPAIINWKGEYFNNTTLFGSPILVRDDQRIDFNWGTGSPSTNMIPADQFSARWTRSIFLEAGTYRLTARGDDGIRVWINGQLVINQWHEAQGQIYTADVNLPSGSASFQVEFYENLGGAIAYLDYQKISGGGSSGNWRGEYFNNRNLTGTPTLTRDDAQINFNWNSGSPASGLNSDNFSVRWTRSLSFAPGHYRFTVTSDDGIRLWVNGQQVLNNWTEHQPQTISGELTLAGGTYPVQIEYFEATGAAQVQVSWTQVAATPPTPAPAAPTAGTGTIVSPMLNVRRGPGFQYAVLTTLPQGTSLSLAGYRSDDSHWVMINYSGTQAWVSGKPAYLSSNVPIGSLAVWQGTVPNTGGPATGTSAIVVNAYYVNLRQTPQVSNNIIKVVPAGTQVQLLGRDSAAAWAKIRLPDQTVGWMRSTYLNGSVSIGSLSVVN